MYEIAHEVTEIEDLYESAVDENGEPRELNDEEKETLKKWILANEETFKEKFDSYGKFIQNLKAALVRIENKTYGICRETGKLIPAGRLRAVPHATLSIEAKNAGAK